MAFTSTDLDAVDRAIASGEMTIRLENGRTVTYRTMGELMEARSLIASSLAEAAGPARMYPRHQLADFSDD